MVDHDEPQEDEWPNDDEANEIMLAYAATDDSPGSGTGCAGVVLIVTVLIIGFVIALS